MVRKATAGFPAVLALVAPRFATNPHLHPIEVKEAMISRGGQDIAGIVREPGGMQLTPQEPRRILEAQYNRLQ